MGRIPTGRRKYEIKRLKKSHIDILKRLVNGQKPKDIARNMGITTQTISNVRSSKLGRQMLAKMLIEKDLEVIGLLSVRRNINQMLADPKIQKRAEEIKKDLEPFYS